MATVTVEAAAAATAASIAGCFMFQNMKNEWKKRENEFIERDENEKRVLFSYTF